jgi:hypothetical protein
MGKARIEASIEAHLQLHTSGIRGAERMIDPPEVKRDGLLAEDVLARLRGHHDVVGVGIGGGADDHRIDLCAAA